MKLPSSKDEKALDAMFRRARAEPDPADLHRVKQQLHTLAAQVEARPRRGAITAITSTLIVVAFGLLPSTREFAVNHVFPSSSPEPAAIVKATPEKAETEKTETAAEPKLTLGVPVAALATVPEEPRAVPVSAAPPRPKHASSPSAEPKPAVAKSGRSDEAAGEAPSSSQAPTSEQSPTSAGREDAREAVREEGEASFLRRAKVSLTTDPARALQMAEEHPSRYPRAVLVQEREVIAIEALSRLGRANEARARAEAFRSRYPHSAHNGHIDDNLNAPAVPRGR